MLKNENYQILEHYFPFWNNLNQNEKEIICDNTFLLQYTKGTLIHSGNNDCIGILVVKKGQLRTFILSQDGREVTLYRLFEGDICILSTSCILDAITFDVFIEAQEDTEVIVINASTYQQISRQNIYVKCYSYELATTRFSDVMWTMQQILFMGADKRLAIFLHNEMMKTENTHIKMTHEQIARLMGSAREVVSRMLKYFESEGIVELSRGEIKIIDDEKLKKIYY